MANRRLELAAFLFGAILSWVVVAYYIAIDTRDPNRAAITDFLFGFLGTGSLYAWEQSGRRFSVLLAEVVGTSLGSWCAVRWL